MDNDTISTIDLGRRRYTDEKKRARFAKFRIRICLDHESDNDPREHDNLGTTVCWHRRENYGDENIRRELDSHGDWKEYLDEYFKERDAVLVLPLAMIDHSGVRFWIGSGPARSDPGGWDSGQCGFVYVTREKMYCEYGDWHWTSEDPKPDREKVKAFEPTAEQLKKAEELVRCEIAAWSNFMEGGHVGFIVERWRPPCSHGFGAGWEHVESCWGFDTVDGYDYVIGEAYASMGWKRPKKAKEKAA